MNIYLDSQGPLLYEIPDYNKALMFLKNKGTRIKCITEITKDNVGLCKRLLKIIPELRHLDGIKGGFSVSEKEYVSSVTIKESVPVTQVIYSSVEQLVEEQRYIFDTLWNKSIPAERKIKEVEGGLEPEFLDVIYDQKNGIDVIIDLVRRANKEALLLMPTSRALAHLHRLGLVEELIKLAGKKNSEIRIISPIDDENSNLLEHMLLSSSVRFLKGDNAHAGMILVDDSKFAVFEIKDSKASRLSDTIGFTIYSNNKASLYSFKSFFESLWNLNELNERLKRRDEEQSEFINIASHELKTPIQTILTYSELLQDGNESTEYEEAILRNSKRLHRLANNLLNLTRIQNKLLKLEKERFDLNDPILTVIKDFRYQFRNHELLKNVKILFNKTGSLYIDADKERLIQVISNLIDNALRFTTEGSITITAEEKKSDNLVQVNVKDSGEGIEPEIMSKLFSKFVRKQKSGTGLGLYISKNIIEAHGGKIWARNNSNGKGATFSFTLPISLRQ